MESGIEFEMLSAKETLSAAYHNEVMTDTTTAMSKDISISWPITCSEKKAQGGVGLWQFFVQTSDGVSKAFTTHTVCRYGKNYNTPPACPWNACKDTECTHCKDGWYTE